MLLPPLGEDLVRCRAGDLVVEGAVVVGGGGDTPQGELAQGFASDVRWLGRIDHFWALQGLGSFWKHSDIPLQVGQTGPGVCVGIVRNNGAPPPAFTLRIGQISAVYGRGANLERTIHV